MDELDSESSLLGEGTSMSGLGTLISGFGMLMLSSGGLWGLLGLLVLEHQSHQCPLPIAD